MDDLFDSVRNPESPALSPELIAARLGITVRELTALAGVGPGVTMTPGECSRAEGFLSDLMRVICAVAALRGGDGSAWALVKSAPVREFDHRPLLHVVAEGRVDEALTYLAAVGNGFSG